MTRPEEAPDKDVSEADSQEAEARRRRRERVFGEVLPESTSDDRDTGAGDRTGGGHDDWLRSNVPPHHG